MRDRKKIIMEFITDEALLHDFMDYFTSKYVKELSLGLDLDDVFEQEMDEYFKKNRNVRIQKK